MRATAGAVAVMTAVVQVLQVHQRRRQWPVARAERNRQTAGVRHGHEPDGYQQAQHEQRQERRQQPFPWALWQEVSGHAAGFSLRG